MNNAKSTVTIDPRIYEDSPTRESSPIFQQIQERINHLRELVITNKNMSKSIDRQLYGSSPEKEDDADQPLTKSNGKLYDIDSQLLELIKIVDINIDLSRKTLNELGN